MRLILIFTFTLISANLNQTHPYSGIFHPPIKAEKDASSLTYPIGSLSLGLFISLLAYHRTKRNKELLSHDKLSLALSMVHRTQTPLTLMQNLLNDIDSEKLPEDISKKLNHALGYTMHVMECYQNIAVLNKLTNHAASEFQTNEFELHTYINSIITHCRTYAQTRRIQLCTNREAGYVSCRINEAMMTATLQCLLYKIIDITPREEHIDIRVSHTDGYWNLQISNSTYTEKRDSRSGQSILAGMPISYCRHFHIVKKIIRLHDGKITGRKKGRGIFIQISIPIHIPCRKDYCPITQYSVMNGYENTFPCKEQLSPKDKEASKGNKVPHVLLVMADTELSGYLHERFSKNFQVSVFDNPELVCSSPTQRNPDVIIVDETVNGIYGSELCSEIKADTCMCNIPVILLISLCDSESYLAHIGCGADKVELRMINVCKLKADIIALINHRTAQKERLKEFAAATLPANHSEKVSQGDSDAILIDKIQKCLEKNLSSEKYTVEMLCADIGMSRTAFYNRVKFIVGKSPTNYILSYKMGIAKTMLASRQYNVSEIATLLGYCDAKYFGKKFKEFYGISPMQYVRDVMG